MDKENKFLQKLDIESSKEFEMYKNYLLSQPNDKELLYILLFNDLISYKDIDSNIDIEEILKNPEIIIENRINRIINRISNKDANLLDELKKKFAKSKSELTNKIKECTEHMELLKKSYIDITLKNFVPINSETKLIFNNKTVLFIDESKKTNYSLSERFVRLMFNYVNRNEYNSNNNNNNNNNNKNNISSDEFYSDDKIGSFLSSDNKPNNFRNIHNNFKYWIILIYLISQIFSKNSNYETLFNDKEFKSNIEKLLKTDVPKKKKKNDKTDSKKDKKKKQKGGDNIENIIRERSSRNHNSHPKGKGKDKKKGNDKDKNKNKISELKNSYLSAFENCYVNEDKTLKKVYIDLFEKKMRNYFVSKENVNKILLEEELKSEKPNKLTESPNASSPNASLGPSPNSSSPNASSPNASSPNASLGSSPNASSPNTSLGSSPNALNINTSVPNIISGGSNASNIKFIDPFDYKMIDIKNIIDLGNSKNIKKNDITKLLQTRKLKYDIFQSLKMFKNEDNLKEAYEFISKIKIKVVLLLFYLYKIKKILYEKYLEIINIKFFSNVSVPIIKKEAISHNKTTNNSFISTRKDYSKNNNNNKEFIDNRIKKLKNEIILLENKKGTVNYDKAVFEREEKIKQLIIEQYDLRKI